MLQTSLFDLGAVALSPAQAPPRIVIDRLIELASIRDPRVKILAPGDRDGLICDAVRDLYARKWPDQAPDILAIDAAGDVLGIKGHKTQAAEFLAIKPTLTGCADLILMAPPLNDRIDMAYLRHAYGFLRMGGRVLSVLNSVSTQRGSIQSIEFCEWLDDHDAELYDLPPNTYQPARTARASINARIVAIEKRRRTINRTEE